MSAVDLLNLAARKREAVSDAKSWHRDCFPDHRGINLMNAVNTVTAVEHHYEGGWKQFLADSFNLKGA